jgi:hypothetical protein
MTSSASGVMVPAQDCPPGQIAKGFDGACDGGEGVNNTCVTTTLGSDAVTLFGLNTDGDVDDNDKLYIGMRCE